MIGSSDWKLPYLESFGAVHMSCETFGQILIQLEDARKCLTKKGEMYQFRPRTSHLTSDEQPLTDQSRTKSQFGRQFEHKVSTLSESRRCQLSGEGTGAGCDGVLRLSC